MADEELRLPSWILTPALLAFLVCALLAVSGTRPNAPLPEDAANERFSATRAKLTLAKVLEERVPHPTGTSANEQVRERIVHELADLGYAPEQKSEVACSRFGSCGKVTNVLARAGKSGGKAVLLLAHYDSVPAGMGASDDGMGVAVLLEVARALAMSAQLPGPVMFLFTDGEEAGLLGAEAFVRTHPTLAEIGVVINVEARGSRGASLMFETSDGGAWLTREFARAANRPLTSSLFYAVYRRMPNDTDLTVFKRVGFPGINLANVGGVEHYHTTLDDLVNLSPATLQHHGDTALALTRRLAGRPELDAVPRSEAVFFDVLGRFVVSWPMSWTPFVVALSLLAWCAALVVAIRKRLVKARDFVAALVRWPIVLALAAAVGAGAFALFRSRGVLPTPWPAYSGFGVITEWSAALIALVAPLLFGPKRDAWAEWAAVFSWWALVSAALLRFLPEAVFMTTLPVATAGVAGLIAFVTRRRAALLCAVILPLCVATLLWIPVLALSRDSLGFSLAEAATLAGAITLTTLSPVLVTTELGARRTLFVSSTALFAVSVVGQLVAPVYTEASPQRMSFAIHSDADTHVSRWLVDASAGPIPKSVREAGSFAPAPVDPEPWFGGWGPETLGAPAPDPGLAAPEWKVVSEGSEGDARHIKAIIRSRRDARMLTLHFPEGVLIDELRVAGLLTGPRARGRSRVTVFTGAGPDGVEVDLIVRGKGHATLSDHSFGLPPSGQKLVDARPAWAVRSQFGDTTVVSHRVDW